MNGLAIYSSHSVNANLNNSSVYYKLYFICTEKTNKICYEGNVTYIVTAEISASQTLRYNVNGHELNTLLNVCVYIEGSVKICVMQFVFRLGLSIDIEHKYNWILGSGIQ